MKTVLVFTKKKYIKDRGRAEYRRNKAWVDSLNGMELGKIADLGYIVHIDYCKIIKVKDHV